MRNWPTLNIQRLFGVALGLKVVFAGLGYGLGSPLLLGLVAPLAVMVAYMYVGYRTRGTEVSEEKFADSCYYLGFIFTIVSIVVCLFDVPKMSAGGGLQDISTRFAAAMISTVLGMAVRVYLVSFRKDASDAMQDVEQALLDTTRLFTAQLQDNLKTLQSFEQQVVAAGQASVAGVQVQVEALARNFSETLSKFYAQLSEENRAAFREMADEAKVASARLTAAVEGYSQGMQGHLSNIEGKITQFADAIKARLSTTEFPDDYFAKRLREPMDALALETRNIGNSVRTVNDEVKGSAVALRATIGSLNAKLKTSVAVMDGVAQLAERHEAFLAASEKRAQSYSAFLERLADIERALTAVVTTAGATNQASGEVLMRLAGLASDSVALRESIRSSLADVAAQSAAVGEAVRGSVLAVATKLDSQTSMASGLVSKVDEHARRTEQGSASVVQALHEHAEQLAAAGGRFDAVTSASRVLSQQLEAVVVSNGQLLESTRKRLEHVERVAAQSESIADSLGELHPLLRRQLEVLQPSAASPSNRLLGNGESAAAPAVANGAVALSTQARPVIPVGHAMPVNPLPTPPAAAGV